MLELNHIRKDYITGDTKVTALKDINLRFRDSEFVSILGQSGCGKTTMLNIIGGLDKYTDGDLKINGISTKDYKDRDWDAYRNNSIGFVFQSYNLIPHQSILANVELALTLSGVSKQERRLRASEALEKVGLKDHIHKRPNQLSGGQMQRVAIARAIVNNPDILLADEPTGALDTETSIQIMDLLKEISKDRLIIMVTHNPELANTYSTRIVKLLDGVITDDSNPYIYEEAHIDAKKKREENRTKKKDLEKTTRKEKKEKKSNKTHMSFFTALSLSSNNLLTKKARTILTAFAGSIGIIGIALILAISNGVQLYIDRVQKETLASYPIQIQAESVDLSSLISSFMGNGSSDDEDTSDKEDGRIYSYNIMSDMLNTFVSEVTKNNLKEFKEYLESGESGIEDYVQDIQYIYDVPLNIYSSDTTDGVTKLNPSTMLSSLYGGTTSSTASTTTTSSSTSTGLVSMSANTWTQLLDNQEVLDSQYEVIAGNWPSTYNEVVLAVNEDNEIDDYTLYALGLKDMDEFNKLYKAILAGEEYETDDVSYTYDEILGTTYKLVLPTDYYSYNASTGTWDDMSDDDAYMTNVVNNAEEIKIVGIIKPSENAVNSSLTNNIGYTKELMEHIINEINDSKIVKQQLANPDVDVFTGLEFDTDDDEEITMDDVYAYIATLSDSEAAATTAMISQMSEEQVLTNFKSVLEAQKTDATFEGNKSILGVADLSSPSEIDIYANGFEDKEKIGDIITAYNTAKIDEGNDEDTISYTDYVGIIMSSVTTIINAISYVLIAFVAISLIVSSIMIGIITYISVLERTKEIGVLRSIGASKRDISRIFNAETLIEGFVAGAMGIIITLIICIPVNIVIKNLTSISNVAQLPVVGAVILVIISMVLTLIAGLVPAKMAAKKDPVVALRTE